MKTEEVAAVWLNEPALQEKQVEVKDENAAKKEENLTSEAMAVHTVLLPCIWEPTVFM